MSTNKTKNYGLHAWEAGDDFLRSEFNENFAKLDEGAARIVTGTYTGDGTDSQFISLGFTPRAVLVAGEDGCFQNIGNYYTGGIAFPGLGAVYDRTIFLSIEEGGFRVNKGGRSEIEINRADWKYRYIAIR